MADNRQYITQMQEQGAVMISEDVITTIVAHTIEEVEGDSAPVVSFKSVDGTLYVYGLPAGEKVSVYTISGQRVGSKQQIDENTVLSLPLASRGVLIVTTSTGISYRVLNP